MRCSAGAATGTTLATAAASSSSTTTATTTTNSSRRHRQEHQEQHQWPAQSRRCIGMAACSAARRVHVVRVRSASALPARHGCTRAARTCIAASAAGLSGACASALASFSWCCRYWVSACSLALDSWASCGAGRGMGSVGARAAAVAAPHKRARGPAGRGCGCPCLCTRGCAEP